MHSQHLMKKSPPQRGGGFGRGFGAGILGGLLGGWLGNRLARRDASSSPDAPATPADPFPSTPGGGGRFRLFAWP